MPDTHARLKHSATLATLAQVIVLMTFGAAPVQAAFEGNYSLDQFVLVNSNADGSWEANNLADLLLGGGNNGSGLPGYTYLFLFAPESVRISFAYEHATLDEFPDYDISGYLKSGRFYPLSLAGFSGTGSFVVGAGESFGFGVETLDNMGGPASLTIRQFQAEPVPEPVSGIYVVTGVSALLLWRRRRERSAR